MPTKSVSSVSNEDILELLQTNMQMTSEWFEKQQSWNEKQQAWNEKQQSWNQRFMQELKEMKQDTSTIHTEIAALKMGIKQIASEQKAQVNDISDILDRIQELQYKEKISKAERDEVRSLLQELIDWAGKAAKNLNIPLNIEKPRGNGTI